MIPKPQSILEKIADTQYGVIIERGVEESYTLSNLFDIPTEFTAGGLGKEFQRYLKGLQAKGKELTMWRFILFFKWDVLAHFLYCSLGNVLELALLLLLHLNLDWINSGEQGDERANTFKGFLLFSSLLVVACFKLFGNFKTNHRGEKNKIQFVNVLGVRRIN